MTDLSSQDATRLNRLSDRQCAQLVDQETHQRRVGVWRNAVAEVGDVATPRVKASQCSGKLAADGPVEDLIARAGGSVHLSVEAEGPGVVERLRAMPGVVAAEPSESADGRVKVRLTASATKDLRPEIFRLAAQSGWTLYELHQEAGSLEDLFRQLTAREEVAQ